MYMLSDFIVLCYINHPKYELGVIQTSSHFKWGLTGSVRRRRRGGRHEVGGEVLRCVHVDIEEDVLHGTVKTRTR